MDRYECSNISALQLMAYDAVQIYQDEHNVPYEMPQILIQSNMDRYECFNISALQLMANDAVQIYQNEHNVPYEIAALKYDIMNNYKIPML